MKAEELRTIKILKTFFNISVVAFEMQHTISKAFGYLGTKSCMHFLHLNAQEEINKEKPNLEKMDKFLAMMEELAKDNNEPKPDFTIGSN